MTKRRLNLTHLFVPLTLIFIGLSLFFNGSLVIELELVILFALFYLSFLMVHHHRDKSLTVETMGEYILLAVLVIIIVLGGVLI